MCRPFCLGREETMPRSVDFEISQDRQEGFLGLGWVRQSDRPDWVIKWRCSAERL